MFCWVFHVLQLQTRGLFHPPTVPVSTLVLSAAEMLRYCVLCIVVLTFLSEVGRENRQMSGRAAACEWLLLCLDKTNCKLPLKCVKAATKFCFPLPHFFPRRATAGTKSSSYPFLCEGEFSFSLVCLSRSACLIKMRRELGLTSGPLARQPNGDANLSVCHWPATLGPPNLRHVE